MGTAASNGRERGPGGLTAPWTGPGPRIRSVKPEQFCRRHFAWNGKMNRVASCGGEAQGGH